MVQRVGNQDAKVLGAVKQFRREVKVRRVKLKSARIEQARIVEKRASQKRWIQNQLAERQRKLAGIQNEIKQLQAEEARRQAQLAAEARARFAAQQAASAAQATTSASSAFSSPLGSIDAAAGLGIAAPPPSQYGGVVGVALQYLGTPYVWGGSSPGGFDCSGLVEYVYNQVGVSLPHNAAAQFGYGTPVPESDLQPGDLVFFDGLGHVGIYIGGGQYIHAPHTGDVVKISNLSDHGGYDGARRL